MRRRDSRGTSISSRSRACSCRTGEKYPTLQLTAEGVALLRGKGESILYRQPRALRTARAKAGRRGAPTAATAALSDAERALFEALRALRLESRGNGTCRHT